MADYLESGSGIERFLECKEYLALPHVRHESRWSDRGTVIHAFLEDVSNSDRATALLSVPDEYRPTCEALELETIDAQLSLAAEVALAWDVEADTVRELGRGAGRIYDDVTADELPATLDVIGIRTVPAGVRGFVADYKSGIRRNAAQGMFGALLLRRGYGCDVVEIQSIHVREHVRPWVARSVVTGWEIDAFADELRAHHRIARTIRAEELSGARQRTFSTGPWCDYCPAFGHCEAQMRLVAGAIHAADEFDGEIRTGQLSDVHLARLWRQIHSAMGVLKALKQRVIGAASAHPITLEEFEDGSRRILGRQLVEGNRRIDGSAAYRVLVAQHGETVAERGTTRTASQESVQLALKEVAPKGKGAEFMRRFMAQLDEENGIARKMRDEIAEFVLPPPALPASPREPS